MTDTPDNPWIGSDEPLGASGTPWLLEVTDLKQYRYCPRVVFYRYCLPRVRPVTYKMEHGIESHRAEADREARRTLQLYGLPEGERVPDITLRDAALGLHGRLDLAVAIPDRGHMREVIPVEYKWSTRPPGPHFQLQVAAYGLLLEAAWGLPVQRGLIYQPPLRRVTPVPITPALRRQVRTTITAIRNLVATAQLPPAPATRTPCVSCEFRRFCNDVI